MRFRTHRFHHGWFTIGDGWMRVRRKHALLPYKNCRVLVSGDRWVRVKRGVVILDGQKASKDTRCP
jgi:hypothetical protein